MVKQSRWFAVAAIAVGLATIAAGALYAARMQQTGTLMHAQIVDVYQPSNGLDRGVHYSVAKVKVVDQAGIAVRSATVTGTFTQCDQILIASARTGSDGFAYLKGPRFVWCCAKSFRVTSVTKTGATWDGVQETVSWPNPCN
jgi:hypothetical protein